MCTVEGGKEKLVLLELKAELGWEFMTVDEKCR